MSDVNLDELGIVPGVTIRIVDMAERSRLLGAPDVPDHDYRFQIVYPDGTIAGGGRPTTAAHIMALMPAPRPPKRIRLSRRKGFRLPANAVNVARPTVWGNPFSIHKPTLLGTAPDGTAVRYNRVLTPAEAVENYRNHHMFGDWAPVFTKQVREALAGKDLACWCPFGQPCHADFLLEVANAPEVARV